MKRYSYVEYYNIVSVGMQMISGQVFNTLSIIEQMFAKSAVLVEAMLAVTALRLATSS